LNSLETRALIASISEVFNQIDREIDYLQNATALSCPPGCGTCCTTQQIEATVLESLPLAEAIFDNGEAEMVLDAVELRLSENDFSCVLYRPDPDHPENGRCAHYSPRPLVCRLFGFAARRNRLGDLELCTCKHISGSIPDIVLKAQDSVSKGCPIPVYQDSFMRIASLNPAIGFKRLPINTAIKQAVEYLFWRRRE
jgi:uncharacterized protein